MTDRDFVYWLQGFFEINNPKEIGAKETSIIKEHLQLVLTKVTGNTEVSSNTGGSGGTSIEVIDRSKTKFCSDAKATLIC